MAVWLLHNCSRNNDVCGRWLSSLEMKDFYLKKFGALRLGKMAAHRMIGRFSPKVVGSIPDLFRSTWDRCYDFLKYFCSKIQRKNWRF
jgi:hypothetical protein